MNNQMDMLGQHTPEVQDILGSPPRQIVRYGMSFFATVALLLVGLSWWIQYPDTLLIPCTLTANAPAVSLSAPASGRIASFLIKDKAPIQEGQLVAALDDVADFKSVLRLRTSLGGSPGTAKLLAVSTMKLGELQPFYLAYLTANDDVNFFNKLQYHQRKINALQQKLGSSIQWRDNLTKQALFNEKDAQLGQRAFNLDSTLFTRHGLTPYEFAASERTHVREQSTYWVSKSALVNANLQIDEIKQSIVELQLDQKQKARAYQIAVEQSYRELTKRIVEWERKNLIKSTTSGIITFNMTQAINLPVKTNEVVATVIPTVYPHMYCKARMPIAGSGKVKIGQRAQVSFDNFPAYEYGTITGQIQNIALVPGETGYLVTISLPYGLKTSHGTTLPYKHDITGVATIITTNQRLLERLTTSFTSLLKH